MQIRRKNILMFAVMTTLAFLTKAAVAERYEILMRDGSVTIDTQFVVKLSDHNIKRPRFLVMKLADEQKVKVVLEARSAVGGEQID